MHPSTENSFEARVRAVSEDLNKFRERRLADRRFQVRDTVDRRVAQRRGPVDAENGEQSGDERRSPVEDNDLI